MKFVSTPIIGAVLIEPEPSRDQRGSFSRLFCRREMVSAGLTCEFVQESESWNCCAGTLRGMHFNLHPHEEVKLVRCTSGSVFDVILDLRPSSPSYLKWFNTTLCHERANAIYIPKGVAHGFQTLVDDSRVFYHISQYYEPGAGAGVRWDDPLFGISWPPTPRRVISDRDASYPDYQVLN